MKYTFTQIKDDINAVKELYPNIDENKFYELLKLDPTYNEGSNSVGTYGKWILNLYKKNNLKEEDFYKVPDYLKEFERKKKLIQNKDINSYKTLPELARVLEQTAEPTESDNQLRKKVKRTDLDVDAELIGNFGKFVCYSPKTYEASCKLGANTEWCTASRSSNRLFNEYNNRGKLYIFIDKSTNQAEYQLHFETNSLMDKYDEPVDLGEFTKNICPEFKPMLFNMIEEKTQYDSKNILQYMMIEEVAEHFKGIIKKALNFKGDKAIIPIEPDMFASLCGQYGDIGRGREVLDGEFLIDAFKHDILSWFEGYYEDDESYAYCDRYLNEKNKKALEDLHLSYENIPPFDGYSNSLVNTVSNARAIGAEVDCLNDIDNAIRNAFKKCGLNYKEFNGDYLLVEITYDKYVELVKNHRNKVYDLDPYGDTYEEMDNSYAKYPDQIIALWASENFYLREPYEGWNGFDEESFNDGVADLISEIKEGKIEPTFEDDEDLEDWKIWFKKNILQEDIVAEGQQKMDLGDSMKYKFKDAKDLEYVFKKGFVFRDKEGKLQRVPTYKIRNYYEKLKGKYTDAQIYYMIKRADEDCDNYIVLHKNDTPVVETEQVTENKKGYKDMSKQEFINYLINSGYSDKDAEEKASVYYD